MKKASSIGIIGGGPTGIYLLKNLIERGSFGLNITIINRSKIGYSTPWSKPWACIDHMANIGSEEIPDLVRPIHEWLASKTDKWLLTHKIRRSDLHPRGLYPRVTMGQYFNEQYIELCKIAQNKGITVTEMSGCSVTDIKDDSKNNNVVVTVSSKKNNLSIRKFDKAIIATGHSWTKDTEKNVKGFYDTPWPITKLEKIKNHSVALIGSSLSAIDVTMGLSMKHGVFKYQKNILKYIPNPGTKKFGITMYSRNGILPHLRHHFEFPRLEIYRYLMPYELDQHVKGNKGYLSLDFMFNIFKDAIKEPDPNFYKKIQDFNLEGFVDFMMKDRKKKDAFKLLQKELCEARISLKMQQPIFWKEILDDVIYTITFEGKKMSAEDMIRFEEVLMPFFSYISAFMPPQSAERLLALHKAGKLKLVAIGDKSVIKPNTKEGAVITYKDTRGKQRKVEHKTLVKCTGQKTTPFSQFPFKSLVKQNVVTAAELPFCQEKEAQKLISEYSTKCVRVKKHGQHYYYELGGTNIDERFRALNCQGVSSTRVSIVAICHIMGLYPYHPGLAFSAHSAEIVADDMFGINPKNLERQIFQKKTPFKLSELFSKIINQIRIF